MSTHFLSASISILPIQTYRIPSLNGERSFIYPIGADITLIEEMSVLDVILDLLVVHLDKVM